MRRDLTERFGAEVSRKSVKQILDGAKSLGQFERKGVSVAAMYDIECDYRYLYVGHNYLFYRIEAERIIIVEMFDEREDFMWKLFGVDTTPQETYDYWDE